MTRRPRIVHVHISNLAAQTGASLFLHRNAPPFHPAIGAPPRADWVYDKTENLSFADLTRSSEITHLIAESAALAPSAAKGWTPVAVVDGFDGWKVNREVARVFREGGLFEGLKALGGVLEMVRAEKLVILRRAG